MLPLKQILLATDFSKGAEPATALAIEMSQRFAAKLTILNIYLPPVHVGPLGDAYALSPETVAKLQTDAERALEALRQRAAQAGIEAECLALEGMASEVILAVAQSHGADLIVMGTAGRSGLSHLLIGSVAERVIRAALCPVLTVRSTGQMSQ